METLSGLFSRHSDFLETLLQISRYNSYPFTLFPSIAFLVSAFYLCHGIFHRRTSRLTSYKVRLWREVGFQCAFFYITRVWFISLKLTKWLTGWIVAHLEVLHEDEKVLWLNSVHVTGAVFSALTFTSLIPFFFLLVNTLWRNNIPNFLVWVGEDPWTRSEIGISGHFLERTPNFVIPSKRDEYAYRSKKSTSLENAIPSPKRKQLPFRKCRMPRKRRQTELVTDSDEERSPEDPKHPQRNAANARERARMRVLSKAFCRLKTTLPWVPADTKLSKLDTLRLATSYIAHLRAILMDQPVPSDQIHRHPLTLTWPFSFQRSDALPSDAVAIEREQSPWPAVDLPHQAVVNIRDKDVSYYY